MTTKELNDLPYGEWLGHLRALQDSAPKVDDVLGAVLRSDRIARSGTWAEFGVAGGDSLRRIARLRGKASVWGFDTFTGLPEDWRKDGAVHLKGHFAQDHIPNVPGAHVVSGLFQETLPAWNPPELITFAHIDCDLYSSSLYALLFVAPRLATNAVVAFDEIFDYPGHEEHELKALHAAAKAFSFDWEFLFVGGERAAIVVRKCWAE